MHVLSQAHEQKFQGKETIMIIGIPGMVGILHVNLQRIDFTDAMRRVNSSRERKKHNMTLLEAVSSLFLADIRFRQNYSPPPNMRDLFNAHRATGHDEERLWAVKDSAKQFLEQLKEIADHPDVIATKNSEYVKILETQLKAYAEFCKFNDWLTAQLTQQLEEERYKRNRQNARRFAPPDNFVHTFDDRTGDVVGVEYVS